MDLKWDRNDHDETFSPMMRSGPCHFDFRLSEQSAKEVLRYCIVQYMGVSLGDFGVWELGSC